MCSSTTSPTTTSTRQPSTPCASCSATACSPAAERSGSGSGGSPSRPSTASGCGTSARSSRGWRRRSGHRDLLTILMLARDDETGETMSDAQLRDEVMTLLIAGHETTANALSWLWVLLDRHPDEQERLRAELVAVTGGRPPTVDDLPALSRLKAVIQETLRLYPPVWMFDRRALGADHRRAAGHAAHLPTRRPAAGAGPARPRMIRPVMCHKTCGTDRSPRGDRRDTARFPSSPRTGRGARPAAGGAARSRPTRRPRVPPPPGGCAE